MVIVDSNVLLRYVTGDGEMADRAYKEVAALKAGQGLLDRLVLAEMCYVLRSVYGVTKPDIVLALRSVVAHDKLTVVDSPLVHSALQIYADENPLSFEDSWLLAVRRSGAATGILTFDKALARRVGN